MQIFRVQPFFRVGAVFTKDTKLNNELSIMQNMKEVLQAGVSQLVQTILCQEINLSSSFRNE